ncbi:MAG: trypsin-like peptidase domain-containing protein [Flavobacteriales bacterium]|nr:trypsin-like peptidase domain-containing protein [Flavobacteriales bacterium]
MHGILRVFAPALLLFIQSAAHAQVAFGGKPIGLLRHGPALPEPERLVLPPVDAAALIAEDEARYEMGVKGPWRFGFNHAVDVRSEDHGTWTTLRNGDRVWRMGFECPGAFSINFRFSRFELPDGGRVFVYNEAGQHLGAFTRASAPGQRLLGVTQLPGDRITVEYHEPARVSGRGRLAIDRVTHAYRDPFHYMRDLGDSGPCNINVICPEGDDWRDQIRSVAIITTGGSGFCTGTLLNNCAQDSTPYFLTANHCLSPDVEDWVFRFNWDSPTCDPTENGPIDQTVSGCVLLTSNSGTDMAFLELSSIPPVDYDVFYAGWDKSGATPDSVCGIHHPSGDIKKISLSTGPFSQTNIDLGTGAADCWQVGVWSAGTTEPGSSGSALFNQNKHVIGQLYGGAANCDNSVNDYYGRLDLSWPFLEQYLGSCGDSLSGLGDVVIPIDYDAAITSIVNIPELLCGDTMISPIVTLKNNCTAVMTSAVITYGLAGGTPYVFSWTGSLEVLQTVNVPLPPIPVTSGTQTLEVTVSFPNAQADQVPVNDIWIYTFTVSNPAGSVQLSITLDNYGTDVTWELAADQGPVLYTGGPYEDMEEGLVINVPFCLTNGCYVFTINDAFGDGICCEEGEGSYLIMTPDSTMLVESDGQYGEQDVQTFCLEGVGVSESEPIDLAVYPNPANETLWLQAPEALRRVLVRDACGRVLLEERPGSNTTSIDARRLAIGAYLLEAETASGRVVKRFVVQR